MIMKIAKQTNSNDRGVIYYYYSSRLALGETYRIDAKGLRILKAFRWSEFSPYVSETIDRLLRHLGCLKRLRQDPRPSRARSLRRGVGG